MMSQKLLDLSRHFQETLRAFQYHNNATILAHSINEGRGSHQERLDKGVEDKIAPLISFYQDKNTTTYEKGVVAFWLWCLLTSVTYQEGGYYGTRNYEISPPVKNPCTFSSPSTYFIAAYEAHNPAAIRFAHRYLNGEEDANKANSKMMTLRRDFISGPWFQQDIFEACCKALLESVENKPGQSLKTLLGGAEDKPEYYLVVANYCAQKMLAAIRDNEEFAYKEFEEIKEYVKKYASSAKEKGQEARFTIEKDTRSSICQLASKFLDKTKPQLRNVAAAKALYECLVENLYCSRSCNELVKLAASGEDGVVDLPRAIYYLDEEISIYPFDGSLGTLNYFIETGVDACREAVKNDVRLANYLQEMQWLLKKDDEKFSLRVVLSDDPASLDAMESQRHTSETIRVDMMENPQLCLVLAKYYAEGSKITDRADYKMAMRLYLRAITISQSYSSIENFKDQRYADFYVKRNQKLVSEATQALQMLVDRVKEVRSFDQKLLADARAAIQTHGIVQDDAQMQLSVTVRSTSSTTTLLSGLLGDVMSTGPISYISSLFSSSENLLADAEQHCPPVRSSSISVRSQQIGNPLSNLTTSSSSHQVASDSLPQQDQAKLLAGYLTDFLQSPDQNCQLAAVNYLADYYNQAPKFELSFEMPKVKKEFGRALLFTALAAALNRSESNRNKYRQQLRTLKEEIEDSPIMSAIAKFAADDRSHLLQMYGYLQSPTFITHVTHHRRADRSLALTVLISIEEVLRDNALTKEIGSNRENNSLLPEGRAQAVFDTQIASRLRKTMQAIYESHYAAQGATRLNSDCDQAAKLFAADGLASKSSHVADAASTSNLIRLSTFPSAAGQTDDGAQPPTSHINPETWYQL